MKRRDFLGALSAAATLPMMPGKAVLGSTAVPGLYAQAAQWAGMWETSSVPMLKIQFGLDDTAARGLFDRLVANQIVGAPDANGVSRVIVSTYDEMFLPKRLSEILKQDHAVVRDTVRTHQSDTQQFELQMDDTQDDAHVDDTNETPSDDDVETDQVAL